MTKADKRWQLLLVADNGRIIPFRHIKGIALTLLIVLILLGLLCLALGWQLTAEKLRHQRTVAQLSDARDQAARFKRELELLSADLVLNEARMEKAGLPVPEREPPPIPMDTITSEPPAAAVEADAPPEVAEPETGAPDAAGTAEPAEDKATLETPTAEKPAGRLPVQTTAREATVAVENPAVQFDARRQLLIARFRIENTGKRSEPAEGRCVVVLQSEPEDADNWFSLPQAPLVNGKPDGSVGQPFKISRFMNMEIMRPSPPDPSVYRTAVIHVFDADGKPVRDIPLSLDLPAPKPATGVTGSTAPRESGPADAAGQADPVSATVENVTVAADLKSRRLTVRLRVKNTGTGSGQLEGRCVVVLKGDQVDPGKWVALPGVPLTAGRPDGTRGRTFRISRFIDLQLRAQGPADPSVFDTAVVFVFGADNALLVETAVSVELPEPPKQNPGTSPAPAAVVATPPAGREAVSADLPAEDVPQTDPAAESSPGEGGGTVKREDARARF